jgi:hypothetical protein
VVTKAETKKATEQKLEEKSSAKAEPKRRKMEVADERPGQELVNSTVRLKYPNAEGKMEWWYGTVTMYDKPYHTIEFDEENNPGPTKSDTVDLYKDFEKSETWQVLESGNQSTGPNRPQRCASLISVSPPTAAQQEKRIQKSISPAVCGAKETKVAKGSYTNSQGFVTAEEDKSEARGSLPLETVAPEAPPQPPVSLSTTMKLTPGAIDQGKCILDNQSEFCKLLQLRSESKGHSEVEMQYIMPDLPDVPSHIKDVRYDNATHAFMGQRWEAVVKLSQLKKGSHRIQRSWISVRQGAFNGESEEGRPPYQKTQDQARGTCGKGEHRVQEEVSRE